jgi:cbb3-type cytochrome oxidase subunit 1
MKSYSVYAGVQDALVQWWYGHNAVAFSLQHLLGLMYYFVPKRQIVLCTLTDYQLYIFGP